MKKPQPFNIIISGVGGQGIVTISRIIWNMCKMRELQVQSSIYKGGAQQLGSIHSIMRIFFDKNENYKMYSPQILEGDLDLMLGLEPWETIRYAKFFSSKTKIVMNTHLIPIETERYQSQKYEDPVELIRQMGLHTVCENFSHNAESQYQTKKMTNYLLVERAILDKLIPFSKEELIDSFNKEGRRV